MTKRNLILCLTGLSLYACGDGRVPLVLYSPHGRDLLRLMEATFESRHPRIDVRWLDMGSQEVYDRIRFEAANPQADVWYGGPDTIFARGAADGLLDAYRPTWAEAVPERSRHPQDLYFGVYRTPSVLVYNAAAISAEEAPKDWDELLEERWHGKVLIRDPLASGIMRTLFGMILARSVVETGTTDRGFEWLRRLDSQTKEYVSNPALLHAKLIRQEGLVSMWSLTDVQLQIERGAPLAYTFPSSGTPVIDDSVALVKGARHRSEAEAFIDWVGSREAQEMAARKVYRLPARTDLAAEELPGWAQQVLGTMVPAQVDWQLMERESAGWMATWDRTIRGKGKEGRRKGDRHPFP